MINLLYIIYSITMSDNYFTRSSKELYEIGEYYYSSKKKNYSKAFEYFTLSAEKGNANAYFKLAVMSYYDYGLGTTKDYNLIIDYLNRAIDYGSIDAPKFLNEHVPKTELAKFSLVQQIKMLKKENEELRKENEELKTHIMAMPDGDLYFEAKKHYQDQLSTIKT